MLLWKFLTPCPRSREWTFSSSRQTEYRDLLSSRKLKELEDTEDDVSVLHSKVPEKITNLSKTASKSILGKLNSAMKLEGNKIAKLIILETLEIKDTKPVSIAKKVTGYYQFSGNSP
jgi:hypothetical protein